MDAGREVAAVAVYEALLAIHGAEWIVEQVGDELRGELAILGLIEEDTVSDADDEASEEEGEVTDEGSDEGDDTDSLASFGPGAGQPMDEE
jgi:hypothetical protein